MNFFIEIILGRIIIRFFGLYTRYFFFKVVGKSKDLKYLSGNRPSKRNSLSQDFFNALVGMITILLLAMGIAYIYDSFLRY
jgi:hypothetical protein